MMEGDDDTDVSGSVFPDIDGDPDTCERKVRQFMDVSGCDELILSVMATGTDRTASLQRTLDWVGALRNN